MALKLITPAAGLAVALEDMKLSLRVDASALDDDITAMIFDAMRLVEHEVGVCLMPQTFELSLDAFPGAVELTRLPVASVVSVTYTDPAGSPVVLATSAYVVDAGDDYGPAQVVPADGGAWPATRDEVNAVRVRYVAGYPDAASVPPHLKRQVKIFCAQLLEDPASLSDRLSAISKVYA